MTKDSPQRKQARKQTKRTSMENALRGGSKRVALFVSRRAVVAPPPSAPSLAYVAAVFRLALPVAAASLQGAIFPECTGFDSPEM